MSNFFKRASELVVDFHTNINGDYITLIIAGTDAYDPTTMTETRENSEGIRVKAFRSHRKSSDHNTEGLSHSKHFYMVKLSDLPSDFDVENDYEDIRILDINGQERKICGVEIDMVKSFARIWIEEV